MRRSSGAADGFQRRCRGSITKETGIRNQETGLGQESAPRPAVVQEPGFTDPAIEQLHTTSGRVVRVGGSNSRQFTRIPAQVCDGTRHASASAHFMAFQASFSMDLVSDFRRALRLFRSSPGLVLVSMLSLGLGMGVNLALFSVIRDEFADG